MVQTEVVLLTANLKKAREEEVNAIAVLDKLRAAGNSVAEDHQAMLIKVREEWLSELDSMRALVLHCEVATAKVREDSWAEVIKVRSERVAAAARYQKTLAFARRIVESRKNESEKAVGNILRLRKVDE